MSEQTDDTDRTSVLGRTIRELRSDHGWSRRTLADRAGIGESTVSRLELYGHTPGLPVLRLLAKALDVSVADLPLEEAA